MDLLNDNQKYDEFTVIRYGDTVFKYSLMLIEKNGITPHHIDYYKKYDRVEPIKVIVYLTTGILMKLNGKSDDFDYFNALHYYPKTDKFLQLHKTELYSLYLDILKFNNSKTFYNPIEQIVFNDVIEKILLDAKERKKYELPEFIISN